MAGNRSGRRGPGRLAVHQQVASGLAELVPDLDRPDSWILFVDGTPQSQVDLADPLYLEFEYVRRLAHILDLAAPAGEPLDVLHLGGGGLTLPRYLAASRPGSAQLAVEFDAALVELVRRHLPLPPASRSGPSGERGGRTGRTGRIRVRVGEARQVLETVREGRFDVVINDVFAGARTPAHLTTVECATAAARALRPDGIYALNVADGAPLAYAKEQVSTLLAVFPHCAMIGEPAVLRGRRFGNLVLTGSRRELPEAGLRRAVAADPFPARLVSGTDLVKFAAGARPSTDATARPSPQAPQGAFAGVGKSAPGPGPRR
jgi:spermidine synthase